MLKNLIVSLMNDRLIAIDNPENQLFIRLFIEIVKKSLFEKKLLKKLFMKLTKKYFQSSR